VVDLKSAIVAINSIHMIIQQITGQIPPSGAQGAAGSIGSRGAQGANGGGSQGEQGSPGKAGTPGASGKSPKKGRFVETQRTTSNVKIYQDNDSTSDNWVEIERINKVVWTDQVTGELIVWSR
jgi:hypothetical protein